ncbi:MAG TPA: hypothetical protein PLB35_05695 [Myxococcota bacterium]|nr:hypothetical protein [Myxococcota bacterium]
MPFLHRLNVAAIQIAFILPLVAPSRAPAAEIVDPPGSATALLATAGRVAANGCGPESGLECPDVPMFVSGLMSMGEFLACGVVCQSLESRRQLPGEALFLCAEAASRLGDMVPAERWLSAAVGSAGSGDDAAAIALKAADMLIAGARFKSAGMFLEMAADKGGDSPELQRRIFSNCLDAGDAGCATSLGQKLAVADLGPGTAIFVIREFFSHDLFQAALPIASIMQERGISDLEQLGIVLQACAKSGAPDRACSAAESCLKRCVGADVETISGAMSRNGLKRQAAEFARGNLASMKDRGRAFLVLSKLWMAAGEKDAAVDSMAAWVRGDPIDGPRGGVAGVAKPDVERLVEGASIFLAERKFSLCLKLLDTFNGLAPAGSSNADEIAFLRVSSLVGRKDWDGAIRAANESVNRAGRRESLAVRLSQVFFDARRLRESADILAAGRPNGIAADEQARSRNHLMAARLIKAGVMKGDIPGEIRAALESAGDDHDVVAAIARFVKDLGLPPEIEILAYRKLAAREPGNPAPLARLVDLYLDNGQEDDAVDALGTMFLVGGKSSAAVVQAIDRFLAARFFGGAFLVAAQAGVADLPPGVARRLSDACLRIGERECVRKYLPVFLAGPVVDDYNYLELSEGLISGGFLDLAADALDVAAKAVGADALWRVSVLKGRIALVSRKLPDAARFFEEAVRDQSDNGSIAVAVSSEYSKAGRIADAAAWLKRSFTETSGFMRPQAYPILVNTLRRLGLSSEINLDPLFKFAAVGSSPESLVYSDDDGRAHRLWDSRRVFEVVDALVGAGRLDLALQFAVRMLGRRPEGALKLIELAGLAGDTKGALDTARKICRRNPSDKSPSCGDACMALADIGLHNQGWDLFLEALKKHPERISGRDAAALVSMAVRKGDGDVALQAARLLSPEIYKNAARIEDVWPVLPELLGRDRWTSLLADLAAREDMAIDGRILVEAGINLIIAGRREDGLALVQKYSAEGPRMLGVAFMHLVTAGLFRDAVGLLDGARDELVAGMTQQDLFVILSSFASRGDLAGAGAFASRYVRASGGSLDAGRAAAFASLAYTDATSVIADIEKVGIDGLALRERIQYAAMLWAIGERDRAVGEFRKVLESDGEPEEISAYRRFVFGFLESEAAVDVISGLFQDRPRALRVGQRTELEEMLQASSDIALPGDAALKRARAAFFRVVRGVRTISFKDKGKERADLVNYIRQEARRGTASVLAREALERRGASFAQTALLAACLAGEDKMLDQAIDRLVPTSIGATDMPGGETAAAVDVLTVADLLFQCGRWRSAVEAAVGYLQMFDLDVNDMNRAVHIAVKGALLARIPNRVTPDFIAKITDDQLMRFSLESAVARAAGDPESDVRAASVGLSLMKEQSSLFLDSTLASIRAGQVDGLDARVWSITESLPFPGRHVPVVVATLLDFFQPRLARDFVLRAGDRYGWTIDRLSELFKARVETGDEAGAIETAGRILAMHADQTRSATVLLAYAAASLRYRVAFHLADGLLALNGGKVAGGLPPDVFDQVASSVQSFYRIDPACDRGARLLDFALLNARDREGACGQLVGRAFGAGPGDSGFIQAVQATFLDGRCSAAFLKDQLADLLDARASGPKSVRFRNSYPDEGWMKLMNQAVRAAMIEGRIRDALDWCELGFGRLGSVSDRVTLVQAVIEYIGDQTSVWSQDRAIAADFALRAIDVPGTDPTRFILLYSQILGMADTEGNGAAVFGVMENEIGISPSSPTNRNNLAYTLSIFGHGKARALDQIRVASELGGMDRGAYLETEAWALFKYGQIHKALQIQLQARRFWSRSDSGLGLAECFNHLGTIQLALGLRADATESFRLAVANGENWGWHSILSMRRLDELGFFEVVNR